MLCTCGHLDDRHVTSIDGVVCVECREDPAKAATAGHSFAEAS